MRIVRMTGSEVPEEIRWKIKLGLRQYIVAIDIQELKIAENMENTQRQYSWSEVTFDLGVPTYPDLTAAIIQSRYPQNDMQAIINNHLLEDGDAEHEAEWLEMQRWRAVAKQKAKHILEQIKTLE